MWPIIPSSFPPTPWVKNHGLNVCKTLCNSSTHFAYFNSWQKVDWETSIVKFRHHSRAYLEGLTKFWGFWSSSAPPYSPFCTLKSCTFDPIPLDNPTQAVHSLSGLYVVVSCKSFLQKVEWVDIRAMMVPDIALTFSHISWPSSCAAWMISPLMTNHFNSSLSMILILTMSRVVSEALLLSIVKAPFW